MSSTFLSGSGELDLCQTLGYHYSMTRLKYITFIAVAAFLAPLLHGGVKAGRFSNFLDPGFLPHLEVRIDDPAFIDAASLLAEGDTARCDSLILGYFCRQEIRYSVAMWHTYPDFMKRADDFLTGVYRIGYHASVELPLQLTWKENPLDAPNWQFNFHALDILRSVNEAYAVTGDRKYIDAGRRLIESYMDNNMDSDKVPSIYSWYDHSVAYRTIHCIDFWRNWLGLGVEDIRFAAMFLDFIWRHGKYLESKSYYSHKTNHGMFQNIALLRLSLAFPEFRQAGEWKSLAVDRMNRQIMDNFTTEMLHREYSPAYHILTARIVGRFLTDCRNDPGLELPTEFVDSIDRIISNIPYLFHPGGGLSMIGDSNFSRAEELYSYFDIRAPFLDYVSTFGRKGRPSKSKSIAFEEAQIFIMRSGWGKSRPYRDESYLIADFSEWGKAHQHEDFMTFELSARGFRWITDLGVFRYMDHDYRRKYIISPMAHNIVVPFKKRDKIIQDKEPVTKAARPETDYEKLEVEISSIERIPDLDRRISRCEEMLEKDLGRLENRVLIILAFTMEEAGRDQSRVRQCLERVLENGPHSEYYEVAREMLSLLGTDPDEMEFTDEVAEMESALTEDGKLQYTIGPESRQESAEELPSVERRDSIYKTRVNPDRQESPEVHFWISKLDYDYLEGSFKYYRDIWHSRAILFIKPYYFLVVDRLSSSEPLMFKQLFHMPPQVEVAEHEDGYMLSVGDSLRCLIYDLSSPEQTEGDVIIGEHSTELQGWYAGIYGNFEPAPVVEYAFVAKERRSYFLARLFVPMSDMDPGRFSIETASGGRWEPGQERPLELKITEPGYTTRVSFLPSLKFLVSKSFSGRTEPSINILRRRR